jgi:predicted dithiol-disulfide oxidoreductase (DUF899 family)
MQYLEAAEKLAHYRRQIAELRNKMHDIQRAVEPEEIDDYEFSTTAGRVRLSELFGDKEYLFVIHNTGTGCCNCTLWADGFNGILARIENHAAFVVASPDEPSAQQKCWLLGVSVFHKQNRQICRVSDAGFQPEDDVCAVWHFLDLLPEGAAGWRPQYQYH